MSNPRRIQSGGEGKGGFQPIIGFSFSKKRKRKKKIKLRKDCQRNSNHKNAELTNEKREMANAKPTNPRTPQQQREQKKKKKKRARETRDISLKGMMEGPLFRRGTVVHANKHQSDSAT
jgi:hypothetical protein